MLSQYSTKRFFLFVYFIANKMFMANNTIEGVISEQLEQWHFL